jgi:hypothetical protein
MPNSVDFNVASLPIYIEVSFKHGIKMRAFKKELALVRKLSPLYAFQEGDIDVKKSRFYWFFLAIADWLRAFFNLEVNSTHPEFIELGARLAHIIAHPANASKKMTSAKALLERFYPCFFVQESVQAVEPNVTVVKTNLNKTAQIDTSTSALPEPTPVQPLPCHPKQATPSAYACSLNERREEAIKIENIMQAAALLDEADQQTASRAQCHKSADLLQKKSVDNCKRFLRHRILAEQDPVHLASQLDDFLKEAQSIFFFSQDDVQRILATFMEDRAFVKVKYILSRHLPQGVTPTFFFQPNLTEPRPTGQRDHHP